MVRLIKRTKDNVQITREQIKEMDDAYNLLIEKKISEEDYIGICAKFGCRPIDKRKEPLYSPGDNTSRVGFLWCCYNSEKGKYFQNVLKMIIRSTLTTVHNLLIGRAGKDIEKDSCNLNYKDARLSFINKLGKEFIDKHIGNENGGSYKKWFSVEILDILLWYAANDINFRAKLFKMMNTISDRKTVFQLTDYEEFNDKKFG